MLPNRHSGAVTRTIKRSREFTHDEVKELIKKVRFAINDLQKKCYMHPDDICVSIPYYFQSVVGWWHDHTFFSTGTTMHITPGPGGRPSKIFGCNIIPAYENKITVFFDECHLAEIEPISIEL